MGYSRDVDMLATSAMVGQRENHPALAAESGWEAILEGYRAGLQAGGAPFVLGERHHWLRVAATGGERDPVVFWKKMDTLYRSRKAVPKKARKLLEQALPDRDLSYILCTRIAGLGSLGRQRFVAIATWDGGRVAREAQALAPTSCLRAGTPPARQATL